MCLLSQIVNLSMLSLTVCLKFARDPTCPFPGSSGALSRLGFRGAPELRSGLLGSLPRHACAPQIRKMERTRA